MTKKQSVYYNPIVDEIIIWRGDFDFKETIESRIGTDLSYSDLFNEHCIYLGDL